MFGRLLLVLHWRSPSSSQSQRRYRDVSYRIILHKLSKNGNFDHFRKFGAFLDCGFLLWPNCVLWDIVLHWCANIARNTSHSFYIWRWWYWPKSRLCSSDNLLHVDDYFSGDNFDDRVGFELCIYLLLFRSEVHFKWNIRKQLSSSNPKLWGVGKRCVPG